MDTRTIRIIALFIALATGLVLLYLSDYSGIGGLVNGNGGSAPPKVEWNGTYGGPRYGDAHSVVQTRDGGYALAGENFCLVKTGSRGELELNRTYFGPFLGTAWSVMQTRDGGYVLAGDISGDFCLVKTGPGGQLEWNMSYGDPGGHCAHSAVQTEDGGYALAGTYNAEYPGCLQGFWLVKTDSRGKKEWDGIYDTPAGEIGYSAIQTRDGGYALAGMTESPDGRDDFWLVKTDSGGREEWNRSYGGPDHETPYCLLQTRDGGYALAGHTYSYGSGGSDFWLLKTDPQGMTEWNRTFGGADQDWALSLIQTRDKGYLLAGYTESYGVGAGDFWLVKTNTTGGMEWNMTCGGPGWDYARAVIQTRDGGYAVAGVTRSYGAGVFWLVKIGGDKRALTVLPIAGVGVTLVVIVYLIYARRDGGLASGHRTGRA